MSKVLRCDGCSLIEEKDAAWIRVVRRGTWSMFERKDPDPMLGDGLDFHSFDCLRMWLMARVEVR